MDNEETKIITTFISAWAWQILAMLFLCSSLIVFAISQTRTLVSSLIFFITFLLFVGCEFASLRRKKKVLEEDNE